jgi:hypothetical protein
MRRKPWRGGAIAPAPPFKRAEDKNPACYEKTAMETPIDLSKKAYW